MYKMVSPAAAAASASDPGMSKLMGQSIQAVNNLGGVVNSIAVIANDLRNIQLANLEDSRKKLLKGFKPQYTKVEKNTFSGFVNDFVGRGAPKFWEALLNMFSGLLKFLVIRPILEWMADPANREKIENTLKTLDRVFRFLKAFLGTNITRILDGLYDMLRDDATLFERLGGFMKAMVSLGAILAPLIFLRHPRATLALMGKALRGFHTGLTKFHRGLKARKMGRIGKIATIATAVGGTAYVGKKMYDYGQDIADRMEPSAFGPGRGDRTLMEFEGSFSMDDIKGGGQTVIGEMVDRIGNLERAYGGLVPKTELPGYATGGWINGPDSGYPVSLGRKGGQADFIGHGLEYVSKNNKGEDFVIPINNFATRAVPGLVSANMREAHAQGFEIPGSLPRGKENFFWGSIKNAFSNKGPMTGSRSRFGQNNSSYAKTAVMNQPLPKKSGSGNWFSNIWNRGGGGTSGIGPVANADSYGAMLQGSQMGFNYKNGRVTMDSLLKNAGSIGGLFGNKGGAIGGAIQTIFGGGGSGKDGKATGWDIFKSIGGVASSFLDPGSKAAGWLGKIQGIGNSFFGPGSEGLSFGQKLGGALTSITGGSGIGGQIGGALTGAPTGWADQGSMRVGEGGRAGGGGPKRGPDGIVRSANGGIGAVIRAGRTALNRGFTVHNHPNFRNNKWQKDGANRRGEDTSGRQPVKGGKLHKRGLAIDITDHRKKQNGAANLRAYADEMFGQRKGLGLAEIANNSWGTWSSGGTKKGPGSHTKPNTTTLGFADRQVAGQGGAALGETDLGMMKKAIIAQHGEGDALGGALTARTIWNQASLIDSGATSPAFGGAKTPTQIIENLFGGKNIFSNKTLTSSQDKKASDMIGLSFDTPGLYKMLGSKGVEGPYKDALMNASTFSFTRPKGMDEGDSLLSFGNINYGLLDNKDFGEGEFVGGDMSGKRKKSKRQQHRHGSGVNSKAKGGQTNTNYGGGGVAGKGGSGGGSGSILGGSPRAGDSSNRTGQDGDGVKDQRNQDMMKKITEQRRRAQQQMREGQSQMVQTTIEAVQANNQAVRSSVAAAQSAIANLLAKSGGGMGGGKLAGAVRNSQAQIQNSNFSALNILRGFG